MTDPTSPSSPDVSPDAAADVSPDAASAVSPDAAAAVSDVVYLHGFASSPGAAKAAWFARKLAPLGVRLHVPDLNAPTFERLRLSAQVERVRSHLDALSLPAPPAVIGSSMGALVALLFCEAHPRAVRRLLLLAPAFRFVGDRLARAAGSSLEEWRERGWIEVAHHADGRLRRVGYELVDDARQFDFDALSPPVPTTVVHGSEDEVIPVEASGAWAAEHPGVTFHRIAGADHGLTDVVDRIWRLAGDFLLGR